MIEKLNWNKCMYRKIISAFLYQLLIGLFCVDFIVNADELEAYRKKSQYDQAITYFALNFEDWSQKENNEHINDGEQIPPFALKDEREELEIGRLLYQTDSKPSILPYKTRAGKFGCYKILWNPIIKKDVLEQRQQFIEAMQNDDALYAKLNKLLDTLAMHELECFSYWNEHDSLAQKVQSLYFSQPKTFFGLFDLPPLAKKLNDYPSVLELSVIKEWFKKICYIIPLLGLNGISTNIQQAALGNAELNMIESFKEGFKQNIANLASQYNFTDVDNQFLHDLYKGSINIEQNKRFPGIDSPAINKRTAAFVLGYSFLFGDHPAGDRADIFQNILRKHGITIPYPIAAGATLGRSLLMTYFLYVLLQDHFQSVINTHTALQQLHKRAVCVAEYIKTIKEIEELLKSNPNKQVEAFYLGSLTHSKKISKKMSQLLRLLESDTLKKDDSWFYSRGNVLFMHKLLQEIHTELTDKIRNTALIDAHVAVVTFMKEAEQKGLPTCFVEFVSENQPIQCTIVNGWSPLVICQKQICNSISLGNDHARTIILTGPNGCGKSTILRVMGINVWLAQTFGVGTAKSVRLTLFDSMRTSLRINDNAATGLSTYMAADAAAERMQTHIDSCNSKHRSLILYGEPYRGTPDQETTRKIMDFCYHVAPNKHFIMALETHVYEPTTLEKEIPADFTNGHMEINEDEHGNFVRTFALKNGPANWWFFDHEKRKRFVDWITVVRKEQEVAQKAYEQAFMEAYEEAVAQAKKKQQEQLEKEKARSLLQKTVDSVKSLAESVF
ncbi:hypothetical protein EKK58_04125 [Candidatus Dependentiae bacterium]|nr:MAG: hypothetical protein EKK58_04125 [Candidatus Dependentiae bacterium]